MARNDRFTFLINADERRMIAVLAQCLNRSRGDAVRFVVREAVRALAADMPAQAESQTARESR